ncbi:hypothetical protein KY285_013687 [Solanum tuberosum]|nr:hypothetical protein KY285_013687 [Solanum tuberosum]
MIGVSGNYSRHTTDCNIHNYEATVKFWKLLKFPRIIGTRFDATEIFCIGTIKDDFLGVSESVIQAQMLDAVPYVFMVKLLCKSFIFRNEFFNG